MHTTGGEKRGGREKREKRDGSTAYAGYSILRTSPNVGQALSRLPGRRGEGKEKRGRKISELLNKNTIYVTSGAPDHELQPLQRRGGEEGGGGGGGKEKKLANDK